MNDRDLPEGFRPGDPTAHDRAVTEYTAVTFTLKEGQGGVPRYAVEEDEPGIGILKHGDSFLTLKLRDGVTYDEARDFLTELRRMIVGISHTKFIT